MIHIIEIDSRHQAQVWFAFNEQDLIRKLQPRLPETYPDTASALRACVELIASATDFRIYPDDATAADEVDSDVFFRSREGQDAGIKLRRQLIELDIIADDI